jgi:hypothetical protein
MKPPHFMSQWKTDSAWALSLAVLFSLAPLASADVPGPSGYQPGDIVSSFSSALRRDWQNDETGTLHPEGSMVSLADFKGKIVFILFFDPWCSICRVGLDSTTSQIRDYYAARNGNANGIPVEFFVINLEPADYAQQEADTLLNQYHVSLRGNDYVPQQVDIAVDLFSRHTLKPVFVAINCVANSPSHQSRELLFNTSGVVESQIPSLITVWQNAIDSVEAPPPSLEIAQTPADGAFEFTLNGRLNRSYRIESTSNFVKWDFAAEFVGTNGPFVFRDDGATPGTQRFFRVISPSP